MPVACGSPATCQGPHLLLEQSMAQSQHMLGPCPTKQPGKKQGRHCLENPISLFKPQPFELKKNNVYPWKIHVQSTEGSAAEGSVVPPHDALAGLALSPVMSILGLHHSPTFAISEIWMRFSVDNIAQLYWKPLSFLCCENPRRGPCLLRLNGIGACGFFLASFLPHLEGFCFPLLVFFSIGNQTTEPRVLCH